jgi:hypothetical protein
MSAEDPADAERVRDRLPQPVPGRDVEIQPGRTVAADLDLVDHVGSARQRVGAVRGRADLGGRSGLRDDLAHQPLGEGQPLGADVVQGELKLAAQVGEAAQVGDDIAGELDAACADERNLDHSSKVFHCDQIRARALKPRRRASS